MCSPSRAARHAPALPSVLTDREVPDVKGLPTRSRPPSRVRKLSGYKFTSGNIGRAGVSCPPWEFAAACLFFPLFRVCRDRFDEPDRGGVSNRDPTSYLNESRDPAARRTASHRARLPEPRRRREPTEQSRRIRWSSWLFLQIAGNTIAASHRRGDDRSFSGGPLSCTGQLANFPRGLDAQRDL